VHLSEISSILKTSPMRVRRWAASNPCPPRLGPPRVMRPRATFPASGLATPGNTW